MEISDLWNVLSLIILKCWDRFSKIVPLVLAVFDFDRQVKERLIPMPKLTKNIKGWNIYEDLETQNNDLSEISS